VGLVWRDATRSGKYSLVDEWADIYLIVLKTRAPKFEPVCPRPIVCNPSSPWSNRMRGTRTWYELYGEEISEWMMRRLE
jgi:hypothetical protein